MKQDDRKPEDTVIAERHSVHRRCCHFGQTKKLAPSVEMADGSVCPWYCNARYQ